jgi:hypothetical protein
MSWRAPAATRWATSRHQAERDIGINDWIDVETGGPAEGQSPPHFEQE